MASFIIYWTFSNCSNSTVALVVSQVSKKQFPFHDISQVMARDYLGCNLMIDISWKKEGLTDSPLGDCYPDNGNLPSVNISFIKHISSAHIPLLIPSSQDILHNNNFWCKNMTLHPELALCSQMMGKSHVLAAGRTFGLIPTGRLRN